MVFAYMLKLVYKDKKENTVFLERNHFLGHIIDCHLNWLSLEAFNRFRQQSGQWADYSWMCVVRHGCSHRCKALICQPTECVVGWNEQLALFADLQKYGIFFRLHVWFTRRSGIQNFYFLSLYNIYSVHAYLHDIYSTYFT